MKALVLGSMVTFSISAASAVCNTHSEFRYDNVKFTRDHIGPGWMATLQNYGLQTMKAYAKFTDPGALRTVRTGVSYTVCGEINSDGLSVRLIVPDTRR